MQLRLSHVAGHLGQVIEALVALGISGRLCRRQHGVELHGHQQGVDHGVLPLAGMDIQTVDGDGGRGSVEVLVLDLALLAAVHRVGILRTKPFQIEPIRASSNLLIRGKGDAQLPVGQLLHPFHQGHELRDPRLVVCAQQGIPAGGDEGTAFQLRQVGELSRRQGLSAVAQGDRSAVIVPDDLGLDPFRRVVRRVHMGDEPQGRTCFHALGGFQVAVHIAVLVHHGVFHAQFLQLFHQQLRQLPLTGGRGTDSSPFRAPGRQLHIAQQPRGHRVRCFHVIDQLQIVRTAIKGLFAHVAPLGQMHHPQAVAVTEGVGADGLQGGGQVQLFQQVTVPKGVILDDPQAFREVDLLQIHTAAEGPVTDDLQPLRQHHFFYTEQVFT